MEDKNLNNNDLPKEIKTGNDNINPLMDIISTLQEKLANSNQNNTENNTYSIPNQNNFSQNINNIGTQNVNNNSQSQENSFDTSKLFEILSGFSGNSQKSTSSNSNPFANIDMETMMRVGKIFSTMNKEDPRKNLLLSLKPFLRNNRQKNVDTYIFILGILNVLDSFSNGDSGF